MEVHDVELWEEAKSRAAFRPHFIIYIAVNSLLWIIWLSSSEKTPWPLYPMLGWGIGILSHYLVAYRRLGIRSIRSEFEKLKKKEEPPLR